MDIDLDELDLDELKSLQKKVTKAIDNFEKRKRDEALEAAKAIASEHGFKLEDLMGDAPSKKSKTKSEPKYAHPENSELTWTGRGRKPAWIIEHLEAGESLDELLIK
ncbi:DNA binding protein, nucleoid-associated [Thalassovita autumnalis]|uniref:DNA binding protein, nucleoid-associated n=1 Tax=Thalassovita autumnalis TaxID=2072972 RepID=A0A0N7LWU6_9RHOB|nr:H-NS histone family protein [Thalassovita autumnalis]CUH70082.1 DNA binding protein, nucleoid-associated [Thalassovita autumnalis]CUH70756.1 DNA binding protein, nucleoid-associated [Thalassovita autumnalis]